MTDIVSHETLAATMAPPSIDDDEDWWNDEAVAGLLGESKQQTQVNIAYKPPGPVAAAFMACDGPKIQGMCGPQGSGKTSAALLKFFVLAAKQWPNPWDGWRSVRVCCVRDTYRQMYTSLIPSWHKWVPKEAGDWKGGKNEPAQHVIRFDDGDGPIELIVDFIAIGDQNAEEVLRGYEVTLFYLNEGDLLSWQVMEYALGRTGRWPQRKGGEGGPRWHGVLVDFNGPKYGTWPIKMFYGKRDAEQIAFFQQPSGLSKEAENLDNLPPGYYEDMCIGQDEHYIQRMVHALPGFSRDGKPVFANEYVDHVHYADRELQPVPGVPLQIGADAGRTPAAIFGQYLPGGRWLILYEIVAKQMGAKQFAAEINRVLVERFPDWAGRAGHNGGPPMWQGEAPVMGWGDPAASKPTETSAEESDTWLQILADETGFEWRPAPVPNNSIEVRLGAMRNALGAPPVDGQVAFLISNQCPMLREGFFSGYRYKKLKIANQEVYEDKPDKRSAFSHPHDAAQYLVLGGGGYLEILDRHAKRNNGPRQTKAISDISAGEWAGRSSDGRQRRAAM